MATPVSATPTKAKRKLALVIGIGKYQHIGSLSNPENDADDMTSELKSIGFIVTKALHLTCDKMDSVLDEFKKSIQQSDMVLFYFAGHGVQWKEQNYLLPADIPNVSGIDLNEKAINAQRFLDDLSDRKPFVTIFLLDCCRTSYHTTFQVDVQNAKTDESKLAGFKEMQGAGALIAFACAPGIPAIDTPTGQVQRNGLFTKYLLRHIKTPNEDIRMILSVMREIFEGVWSPLKEASKTAQLMTNSIVNVKNDRIIDAFALLRISIDKYEKILLHRIDEINTSRKKLLEDYEDDVMCEEQKLVKSEKDFDNNLLNNNYDIILKGKKSWIDIIKKIAQDVGKLKPPTTVEYNIEGIDQLSTAMDRILNSVRIVQRKELQNELLQHLRKETVDKTTEVKSTLLMDILKIQSLRKQVIAGKMQIALVGEHSCGKTSLIHYLLKSDPFLPSDIGSVSARITCLTYADSADACLRIYSSLEERHQKFPEQISLSEYFSESEPDWDGVKDRIAVHVKRPKNLETYSKEFSLWAKSFVEIRIPSNFLKLGIDLYDTPGLIYSDPPVLQQNLHALVKTVIPTVVFMYENSCFTCDTSDCFLALKTILGKQLDDTSIFFLNAKVDIGTIVNTGTSINDKEFEKITLVNARQRRKDLLLKVPGMAQQMFHNSEFDIISVESQWDPCGIKMNQLAIDHLIQFVAISHLKNCKTSR
ncbi:unnamed protein product [Rotaria magnacalcarata]|uniref:Caspase family p20 domain-containing protein n=2 Tax=Rotaria magnacalcarata TaxID=392030 RepID=A0A814F0S8_9BILA|nr:unnamed protein product [Rotaria magnacalcarata]